MNKLYYKIAAFLVGKLVSGKNTIYLSYLFSGLGALSFLFSLENMQMICENYNICIQGSKFFGIVTLGLAEIMKILRYFTGISNGDTRFVK